MRKLLRIRFPSTQLRSYFFSKHWYTTAASDGPDERGQRGMSKMGAHRALWARVAREKFRGVRASLFAGRVQKNFPQARLYFLPRAWFRFSAGSNIKIIESVTRQYKLESRSTESFYAANIGVSICFYYLLFIFQWVSLFSRSSIEIPYEVLLSCKNI